MIVTWYLVQGTELLSKLNINSHYLPLLHKGGSQHNNSSFTYNTNYLSLIRNNVPFQKIAKAQKNPNHP